MGDINCEAVSEVREVAPADDKAGFWRVIDRICSGADGQKGGADEQRGQKQKDQKVFSVSETLSEQTAAVIKTYCSFQPLDNEIAGAAERLIAFASTRANSV